MPTENAKFFFGQLKHILPLASDNPDALRHVLAHIPSPSNHNCDFDFEICDWAAAAGDVQVVIKFDKKLNHKNN